MSVQSIKKIADIVSDSTLQPNFKKLLLVKFGIVPKKKTHNY